MPASVAPMWTLDEATALIRAAQPFAKHAGYHLGIAGGVLNNGESVRDLDVMVMPRDDEAKHRSLRGVMRAFEFVGVKNCTVVLEGYGKEPGRTIYRGYVNGKVIELFVFENMRAVERLKRAWQRVVEWAGYREAETEC